MTSPSKHPERLSRGQREHLKCSLGLSLGRDVAQFKFLLLITGIVLHVLDLEWKFQNRCVIGSMDLMSMQKEGILAGRFR